MSGYDVIIVGAGPVGLAMANFMGLYGVRAALIERKAGTVTEPRAVSIDDESLRAMQAIGLSDSLLAHVMPDYGSTFYDHGQREFARAAPTSRAFGFFKRNAFHQDVLERLLHEKLGAYDNISVLFEHELTEIEQDAERVRIVTRDRTSAEKNFTCRFLLASDGARSTVRHRLGIEMCGSSFSERWLIIDLKETKDPYRQTRVFCNPNRPGICLPGPGRSRRFEFRLRPDESDETALDEQFVRGLLAQHGPDERAPLRRTAVYTFHARMAERWRDGRIFLHGDAAHLTPPFAGQGLNSGFRDVHNFAWKVALVVKGLADQRLLDTYQIERRAHAQALIDMAMRLGWVMTPRSRLHALAVAGAFRLLTLAPPLKRYILEMRYKPEPQFATGFAVEAKEKAGDLVGRMFPQPNICVGDNEFRPLDDVLGKGFSLIAFGAHPRRLIKTFDKTWPTELPIRRLCVTARHENFPLDPGIDYVRDAEGAIEAALAARGVCGALLRPDRYVAGLIRDDFIEQDCARIGALLKTVAANGCRAAKY